MNFWRCFNNSVTWFILEQPVCVFVTVRILFVCCVYSAGESCFEVKIEADSNDITEQPHDDKPRPYLCTVCDKRFSTRESLSEHKLLHDGDNLYLCIHCQKRFYCLQYLKTHMNVHSSKYRCTECGKGFKSNHELTKHGRTHSREKPFECTVCSKKFRQKNDLAQHRRIHSGEKTYCMFVYSCGQCKKRFMNFNNWRRHVRVHNGEYNYTSAPHVESVSEAISS